MATSSLLVAVVAVCLACAVFVNSEDRPAYIKPCKADDPKIAQCFIGSLHHLAPYMAKGIPEIQLPSIEPYRLEELSLALTGGPNGYRITLKDMDIFGMSNFTVNKLKLSKNGSPFEAQLRFPRMTMSADYRSSGVLLILPASGTGTLVNTLGNTLAKVKGTVSFHNRDGKQYMKIDALDLDFTFDKVAMHVENAHKNNPILREATNLFLRENGLEVVDIMKPQLAKQLSAAAFKVTNTILKNTPIDLFYIQP